MASNTTEATGPPRTTLDRYYRALANQRRRTIVAVLEDRSPIALADLVEACLEGIDQDPERVKVSLVHAHLPVLMGVGAIAFEDGRIVQRQPGFARLSSLRYTGDL